MIDIFHVALSCTLTVEHRLSRDRALEGGMRSTPRASASARQQVCTAPSTPLRSLPTAVSESLPLHLPALLLSLWLLLSLPSPSRAQSWVTECGGGYALPSLRRDLSYYGVEDIQQINVTVNLCGPITTGTCAGLARPASVCVESSDDSAGTVAAYYAPDQSPVIWESEHNLVHWMNPFMGRASVTTSDGSPSPSASCATGEPRSPT